MITIGRFADALQERLGCRSSVQYVRVCLSHEGVIPSTGRGKATRAVRFDEAATLFTAVIAHEIGLVGRLGHEKFFASRDGVEAYRTARRSLDTGERFEWSHQMGDLKRGVAIGANAMAELSSLITSNEATQ